MNSLLVFVVLSLIAIVVSHKSLFAVRTHGFYRFWGWVSVAGLFACNYPFWFRDPLSLTQLFSWTLLLLSLALVLAAVRTMRAASKTDSRNEPGLFAFERTSELVEHGVFEYIRHPMYTSLVLLAWGIQLKNLTILTTAMACLATVLFYVTARAEEEECLTYFGDAYRSYMKRTSRFVPFLF